MSIFRKLNLLLWLFIMGIFLIGEFSFLLWVIVLGKGGRGVVLFVVVGGFFIFIEKCV